MTPSSILPRLAALGVLWALGVATTSAKPESFESWLVALRAEALKKGVGSETLEAAFRGVKPLARVIELDRHQPEFTLTFEQYITRVVSRSRIEAGRARLAKHRALLDKVAEAHRVQPRFIVALWGIESDFGRVTGGFRVIPALATLAHDGRRGAYFRRELLAALKILDEGHIGVREMVGSWAGAMGQSQFMPSSFRAYARDFDGDGRRDIWTTLPDVFASAANYLSRSGWRADQTWGRRVRLPKGFQRSLADLGVRRTIPKWAALGVRKANGEELPTRPLRASIIIPSKGGGGPAFIVYDNYRTLLKWNRSHFFALAVGRLSDAIGAP